MRSAALPAFNQKFEKNGQPIAEKPLVARDFIEFRTARGFPLDGYKDLAGNPQSLSQFKDKLVIVDVWGSWSATCQRSARRSWPNSRRSTTSPRAASASFPSRSTRTRSA
ncbi:MAG: TlpA family protein disulfide reductase [Sutterella wadsworthensis]